MIKRLTYILLLMFTALSCVYPYDANLTSSDEFIPVIDGSIIIGDKATISVGKMVDLDADYSMGFTGKDAISYTWWVEDDKGIQYNPTASAPSVINLNLAPVDRQYRMVVSIDGKKYESAWQAASKAPEMDNISFWADERNVYVGVTVKEDGDSGTGYIAFNFEETWEFHVDYVPEYVVDPETWAFEEVSEGEAGNYYCWTSQNSYSDVVVDVSIMNGAAKSIPVQSFSRTDNRNNRLYSIKVFARSISEEEFLYRSNLESNKDHGNDLFTPNPGEMAGNIVCASDNEQRVFGFVSISRSSSLREFMDNRYLIPKEINDAYLLVLSPAEYERYYSYGYRPVKESVDFEGNMGYGWAPLRCIDCTYAGGTLERPDFWPGGGHTPGEHNPGEAEL